MNFENYRTEDLILEETFQKFVLKADPAAEAFWHNWLAVNPDKQPDFDQAVALLMQLEAGQEQVPATYKEEGLKRLLASIHNPEAAADTSQEAVVRPLPVYRAAWFKVAAAITGLILVSVLIRLVVLNYFSTKQYHTAYGQTQTILLPDQSTVILNGNTTIRYAVNWSKNAPREVWLAGEAYFSVRHKANNQKFTVRTKDGFAIEVLGTQFSVTDRKSHNRVVLNEGKVKVQIPEKSIGSPTQLILKPGELVQFGSGKKLVHKKVNAEAYAAWKDNVLVFEETPLTEIVSTLEESYGLQVKITNAALADIKITGATSTTDLIGFLNGLAKLHNFNIKQTGRNIYIGP